MSEKDFPVFHVNLGSNLRNHQRTCGHAQFLVVDHPVKFLDCFLTAIERFFRICFLHGHRIHHVRTGKSPKTFRVTVPSGKSQLDGISHPYFPFRYRPESRGLSFLQFLTRFTRDACPPAIIFPVWSPVSDHVTELTPNLSKWIYKFRHILLFLCSSPAKIHK